MLALTPRRAETQAAGTVSVGSTLVHTSIYEKDIGSGERVFFDGEVSRLSAWVRHGIGPRTDLEVEVAAIYASSGFLDSFVTTFHDTVGLAAGGRDLAEDDEFDMRVRRNGELAYRLPEDEFQIADVPVILTHRLRAETPGGPGLAARIGVELPLGSQSKGAGNGGFDFGGGVLIEKSCGRWTYTGALDFIVPSQPDRFDTADMTLREFVQMQNGYEYRWSDRTSILAQLVWTGPMTRDIDLEVINREVLDLGVGLATDLGGAGRLTFSFHEDVIAATGPDFSFMLGISWDF